MMRQKQNIGNPGFTTSVCANHARPRVLPGVGETRKLEQETLEKMQKLAEIWSTAAAERQMTEDLRREVSSKGWSSLNPMPPSYEKSMKPVKSLLQNSPPSNFKIKHSSSTFKSPDAINLNARKLVKHGPPPAHDHLHGTANHNSNGEEANCTSAMEALKEWHNSNSAPDAEPNMAKKQQQIHSGPVPISSWEGSNENHHGSCRPMEIDTIPREEPDRTWTSMNTQTERPSAALQQPEPVESNKPPTTIEGTYFQHLFLHQDYHRKVLV